MNRGSGYAFLGILCILLGGIDPLRAQTSYPMITHTTPAAVQRGSTVVVTVSGQMNFHGVYKALFEGTGITAEVVPGKPAANPQQKPMVRSVDLKITVAPNANLGVREFRLAANLGISSIGQLVIVDAPVVRESGNNNTQAQANPIPVPSVVSGAIEAAEDVDFFKIRAEAGQVLTFEVRCARLQDKIHDLQKHANPMVVLYDAEGRELAANDDFYFADPLLTFAIPKAGDYLVQVRDSKYDGDPRWSYALAVTSKPYVSHVFPMAANPGQKVLVEPVGSARSKQAQVEMQAPGLIGLQQVQLDVDGNKTNPTAFIVSTLAQNREVEPNDTPAQATKVTIPCGINGRIGVRRDLDHFAFQGTKGKAVRFEVKARRFGSELNSSLDSFLDVMSLKGDVLASNDDTNGKDAALVFTPAADGEYLLRIRDLNSKGGETAVYFIEADWATPDFTLRCDPDKAMIGPGSSTAWYVQVNRLNGFTGPVEVEVKGLPRGVTVNTLTIPASMTQGALVLTAAPGAVPDVGNVQIVGKATVKQADGREEALIRQVVPGQEIYLPGGGRGMFDVNLQTVAVTEPSDILAVEVSPKTITLRPGEEVRLDVTVQRRADYDKTISLDVLLRHLGRVYANPLPPGVTIVEGKSKTLLGTGNKGHIVLRAAPTATPVENVPVAVLCHVSINFVVKVSYSSLPIPVTVSK